MGSANVTVAVLVSGIPSVVSVAVNVTTSAVPSATSNVAWPMVLVPPDAEVGVITAVEELDNVTVLPTTASIRRLPGG